MRAALLSPLVLLAASAAAADSVSDLKAALEAKGPGGKMAAVRALSALPGAEAADALASVLAQEGPVALRAACALSARGDARGEAVLQKALASSQPLDRAEAARALGSISSAPSVPDLVRALEDETEAVRSAAIESLREITLQEFDFEPGDPAHILPRGDAERQELEVIRQWRIEQMEKLKEGKYQVSATTEITVLPRDRDRYMKVIQEAAVAKWDAFRKGYEAKRREARVSSVAQWREWWEAHKSETPGDWLKAGLGHAKADIRRRAAAKIEDAELKEYAPALTEALSRDDDVGAAAGEARALASFRDKAAIPALIAYLERRKGSPEAVSTGDRVLVDLTGVEGVPPSGERWKAWWTRVEPFFEPGAVKMSGDDQEYAVKLVEASSSSCAFEVRRWIPGTKSWLMGRFEAKAGEAVGKEQVEAMDQYNKPVKIDLTPGLTLESAERGTRVARRKPLLTEGVWRAALKPASGPSLKFEIPAR